MVNNSLGFKADYIQSKTNVLTDLILRVFILFISSFTKFVSELPSNAVAEEISFKSRTAFLPLLRIVNGQDQVFLPIKNFGYFTHDNITSFFY